MRIAIDIGHNVAHDSGAHGIVQEDTWTKEVGTMLINKLRSAGHIVIETLPKSANTTTEALKQRTDVANREKAEKFVSVHFNAGGGQGSEVLYKTDPGKKLGEPILKELAGIGFPVRQPGMVYRDNLWVLNKSEMPAVIVESLFVDTPEDVKRYNAEKISEAIYRGITGKPSISYGAKPPVQATAQGTAQVTVMDTTQVKNLQLALNLMNITDNSGSKLAVDGVLGAKTKEAVTKLNTTIDKILK